MADLESKNIENVDHFKQLISYQKEITNSKNDKNIQELNDYIQQIIPQIDFTLPPYYIPNFNTSTNQFVNKSEQTTLQGGNIAEPYSELSDYLDKDDFTNLLRVLGQFAGKTGSGLLNFGETVLSQFVFKKKKKKPEAETEKKDESSDSDDYVVPGQMQPLSSEDAESSSKRLSTFASSGSTGQNLNTNSEGRMS